MQPNQQEYFDTLRKEFKKIPTVASLVDVAEMSFGSMLEAVAYARAENVVPTAETTVATTPTQMIAINGKVVPDEHLPLYNRRYMFGTPKTTNADIIRDLGDIKPPRGIESNKAWVELYRRRYHMSPKNETLKTYQDFLKNEDYPSLAFKTYRDADITRKYRLRSHFAPVARIMHDPAYSGEKAKWDAIDWANTHDHEVANKLGHTCIRAAVYGRMIWAPHTIEAERCWKKANRLQVERAESVLKDKYSKDAKSKPAPVEVPPADFFLSPNG